jgi:hypothetical protein
MSSVDTICKRYPARMRSTKTSLDVLKTYRASSVTFLTPCLVNRPRTPLSKTTRPTCLSLFPSPLSYVPTSSTTESQVGVEGSAAAEGTWNLVARKVKRLKYAVSDSSELV